MKIAHWKYNWRGTAGIWINKGQAGPQKQKQWETIAIPRAKEIREERIFWSLVRIRNMGGGGLPRGKPQSWGT